MAATVHVIHASPVGNLTLVGRGERLAAVHFADPSRVGQPAGSGPEDPAALPSVRAQLDEYFAGVRQHFDVVLAWTGTPFQQRVWRRLLTVPYGTTCSYLDIAVDVGGPNAVRAVGTANGANPIPVIVPCHRVIGSDGSLVGYAGGIDRKRRLLDLEAGVGTLFGGHGEGTTTG